ncbi:MAG: RidA family protein [Planctomycetota bacterium]|nr:MAG: RidA family protein [Planctomycetota bacterium]
MTDRFERAYTGSPWEKEIGFCRALRAGPMVFTAGTAPVADDGATFAPGDAESQTARCYALIERALEKLGAGRHCIVRCRMYVTDITRESEYGRAHRAFFRGHHPCLTMVEVSKLVRPDMLVEVEAEAVVTDQVEFRAT